MPMSTVIPFQKILDGGGSDSWFVLYADEFGRPREANGGFRTVAEARSWACADRLVLVSAAG